MRRAVCCTGLLVTATALSVAAEDPAPPASEVVARSIAHHDPQGRWQRSRFELHLTETRPDGGARKTRLRFDNSKSAFEILTSRGEAEIEGLLAGEDCLLLLNGSAEFSEQERDEYRLTCERLRWLRDYYLYLWGLPMKLHDPGTRLDSVPTQTRYRGRPVWTVRATYDEEVGTDTWYFYFDPRSYALVGYRFYHDESKQDGEYIVLDGETAMAGMRIPTTRAWYTNAEDEYLGTDTLTAVEIQD